MTSEQEQATAIREELPEHPDLITISLAAEILGVSRTAAHQMAYSRQLRAWRIPSAGADRPLVVSRDDVLALKRKRGQVVVSIPAVA